LPFRYLIKRRITYLAVLAVALSVFVVIVVMTVLSGLIGDIKQKYHFFLGDCVVNSKSLVGFAYYEQFMAKLDSADFVKAASPVIKAPALVTVTTHTGETYPNRTHQLMGIDPIRHSRVTGFGNWLKYHKDNVAEVFAPAYDPNLVGCVSGVAAHRWDVVRDAQNKPSKVSFDVTCFPLTAKGALARAGTGLISTKTFYISDRADVGLFRIDEETVYVPFEQAQMLCGMAGAEKRVNQIHIKFRPGVDLETGRRKVAALWSDFIKTNASKKYANLLSQVRVQSWKSYKRGIIAALDTEQAMMLFVFALVGTVAVFIVFVVFYMIVSHKSKDIGILKSIGVSSGETMLLFLYFAFLLGLLATAIGSIAGWQFLVHINQIEAWLYEHFEFRLWDQAIYPVGGIPNRPNAGLFVAIITSGIVASLIGALVPSIQAARRRPIETLQVSQI